MGYEIQAPNTGAALAAQIDPAELWSRAVLLNEGDEDPFMDLEGGSDSIVETKTETAAGAGTTINFRVSSDFGDEGMIGDELFEETDDYEQVMIGEFPLKVDWLRHATAWTKRGVESMGLLNEFMDQVPQKLGRWLGVQKSHRLQMTFLHKTNGNNHFYAGVNQDALTISDCLTYDQIVKGGAILQPLGGTPARLGKDKEGNSIWGAAVIATNNATYGLKKDSVYRANLQNGAERGMNNLLWSGGLANIDGHYIREYTPKRGDIEGAVGSPLNPQALLGVAIASGTANIEIKGGGNSTSAAKTKKKFFKFFPKYGYRFLTSDTLSETSKVCWDLTAQGKWFAADATAADVFYVRITNPPNAATDPGKWGMYECKSNDGNKLTTTARLAGTNSADSGAADKRATTLGSVTWSASVNTVTHAAGSLVTLCNARGTPLGATLFLYRQAAYRGYGSVRNQRQTEEANGKFVQRRFIESVFGQCVRQDRVGNMPAVGIIKHAIHYPGLIDS
jgi:hypothetical protein